MNYIPQEEILTIKGYEVRSLEFGMARLGLPFVKHTTLAEKIAEAMEHHGTDPEFWGNYELITVPKDEFHIACAAVSFRESKDEAGGTYGRGGWFHPLSATHARNSREAEICTEALEVLAKASGGEQALEDIIQEVKASIDPNILIPPPYLAT